MSGKPRRERYLEILPLRCRCCGHRWDQLVGATARNVPCRSCGSLETGIIPPEKILDFNRANHYHDITKSASAAREEDSPEPERVLRATALEPVDVDEVIIVEEIG